LSAGTSWRRRGSGGGGGLLAWLILAAAFFFIVAWPYLLGTYVAVAMGAFNPSTQRFVVGWFFEVVYIAALVALFVKAQTKRTERAAEEADRMAKLTASGAVYEAKSGRSVVYRHGTCSTNHRSAETAQRCTKSDHEALPSSHVTDTAAQNRVPLAAEVNRNAIRWSAGILAVGFVAGFGILIADPIHSAAGDAREKPCPAQLSGSSTAAVVSMPDLVGQNAGGVEATLKGLGLTGVELASANPEYKSVWVASNWTVVSTDPGPGCSVSPAQHVTVYVTK
jgi:hypothetical protein